MSTDCLFCNIVRGNEPASFVRKTDEVVVFEDKFPRAPVHLLVVPRKHIASFHELDEEHRDLAWRCMETAQQAAETSEIADGYRLVTNIGSLGGQAISHLHFHVLGGKQLGYVDGAGDRAT